MISLKLKDQEELIEQLDIEVKEYLSEAAAADEDEEQTLGIELKKCNQFVTINVDSRVSSSKSNVALYTFISIDVKSNALD